MLDFSSIEIQSNPFQYFVLTKAFDREQSEPILSWFVTDAPWKLVETDFYEQYEFDFFDVEVPEYLFFLKEKPFLDYLTKKVERIFEVKLKSQIDLTAHKLLQGQRIRLHNDYIEGQETHRILIQLNRNWKDENGGFLLFFNSSDPADVHRVFRPIHNTSVGFAISPKSNHAVSTIHAGERYTLVYSFYAKDSNN
jgi:Rps23 Pro-64 3,4-dihydroxylase Tpa1-like proline 4-hydroxylase